MRSRHGFSPTIINIKILFDFLKMFYVVNFHVKRRVIPFFNSSETLLIKDFWNCNSEYKFIKNMSLFNYTNLQISHFF